jgi:hypothetical protein
MKQLVRGWLASPCSVPPIFALKSPVLRGFVEGKRGVALPSEGRGHRFESCRVRQSLQRVIVAALTKKLLSSGLLACYAAVFATVFRRRSMDDLRCTNCAKKLSRKTARLIEGKLALQCVPVPENETRQL